ncbi:MAG: 4-alpha-glucanotransferase [Alphaproteobacteria bacterium]
MTDENRPLDRLAALYGIIPAYQDIWGVSHPATDETKRALLAAMGAAAETDAEAEACLEATEAAGCRSALPPAIVIDGESESPGAAPIWLPEPPPPALAWSIAGEHGETWRGTTAPGDRPAVAERAFDGRPFALRAVALPALPIGYHTLSVALPDGGSAEAALIVAPRSCFGIDEAVGDARVWGVAAQLYGLRSDRNWGLGDFVDLADLGVTAAGAGAAAVGINPVHAGFAADPHHFSPYAPSTRIFLNHLYIDPTAVPEFTAGSEAGRLAETDAVREAVSAARLGELVDYAAVAAAKMPVLEALHRDFDRHATPARKAAFAAFRDGWGEVLQQHAVFEALHEHFFRRDMHLWSWRTWPEPYRDPSGPAVAAFAVEHAGRVDFFAWLQWVAEEQMAAAQARVREAGMRIGVYRDLAVASDGGGSMAWSWPRVVLSGVSVGAPPDDLGPQGQNWGLSPLSPHGLREAGYQPFIQALRANMRHAGALRIDHVMALARLFWIPPGKTGRDGAYVRYPFGDLVRIVALESRRNRCVVIGEDLGTLPEGFQETLQSFGILSYRILSFERREDGALRPPAAYPDRALVAIATHDMPTVRGFWTARDVDWRARVVAGITDEWVDDARADRRRTRAAIVAALHEAGLDPGPDLGRDPDADPDGAMAEAVHRFIARTPARLLMVQLEDLLDLEEQANLPGTSHEHPNWRRRLACSAEGIFDHPHARRIVAAVNEERGG